MKTTRSIALDEVADLLKTTSSVALHEVADLGPSEDDQEQKKKKRERKHNSPIADNFIFTDRIPGHLDKDFITKVKPFPNDCEIQRHFHEYLDKCCEMNTIYKKAIKAVLTIKIFMFMMVSTYNFTTVFSFIIICH